MDEINHTATHRFGFRLQRPTSRSVLIAKREKQQNYLRMRAKTSGFVLLPMVLSETKMQMLPVPVGWTMLVDVGGGGFHKWPQSPLLTECWESHPDLNSHSRQTTNYAFHHFSFKCVFPWKCDFKKNKGKKKKKIWLCINSV